MHENSNHGVLLPKPYHHCLTAEAPFPFHGAKYQRFVTAIGACYWRKATFCVATVVFFKQNTDCSKSIFLFIEYSSAPEVKSFAQKHYSEGFHYVWPHFLSIFSLQV